MSKSSGDGKNLIFIHGSGGNGAIWAYQSKYFSPHHNVFAIDLPGHGRNKEHFTTTVPEYANYINSLIQEKCLALPIIVGHSLGGAIALRVALDKPSTIGGLVLVGTGARLRVLPALFDLLRTDFDRALAMISEYAFSPQTSSELVTKAMSEMRKGGPEVVYNDFAASDGFDVMSELSHVTAPALIVVGRDDRLTPVKYSEYLNRNISGSELAIIDGAGHMVMIEQPEAFNAALDSFLRTLK